MPECNNMYCIVFRYHVMRGMELGVLVYSHLGITLLEVWSLSLAKLGLVAFLFRYHVIRGMELRVLVYSHLGITSLGVWS